MKISLILSAILLLTIGAMVPTCGAQTGVELETLSAATARDFPGLTLQISLEKPSFASGEPIAVTLIYRNEGSTPVALTRGNTRYNPMNMVQREFRARQLDGDTLLQSATRRFGAASEMVGIEIIQPQQSLSETVFLNERFFMERAGRYQLTAWSDAVSRTNQLSFQRAWLQSAPVELQIVPATAAFKAQVLSEASRQIEAARSLALGRSLNSYPPELEIAAQAARRLGWLHDERAIPILVAALEIGNNYQYEAQRALQNYPREAVKAAIRRRLNAADLVTTSRSTWLQLGDYSPAEKPAIEAQFDNRFRAALAATTDIQRRGYLATRGLEDSPGLRQDPQFWHEALTNPAVGGQNISFGFNSLLRGEQNEEETRAAEYPIQTADLKVALERSAAFQGDMPIFHALEPRDPTYLRQFLLARVDNMGFLYPRGAFEVFNDEQLQSVAVKLIAAIQNPEWRGDSARLDDYGRRLRDMALRGATIAQLESLESWLLQNAPAADAPILDAIALKMPGRAGFWLRQSLARRPLESPYDNRMWVLVLQQDQAARQIVRDLLQNGSEQRRLEVLQDIYYTVAPPFVEESQARWQSGNQVLPRATPSTFDDLQTDLAALTTSDAATDAVKQAAKRAYDAVVAFKQGTGPPPVS